MSKENSQKITEKINAVSQELKELALSLDSRPELSFHEFFACETLTKILEKYGYQVQKGAAGLKTAFIGEKRGREAMVPPWRSWRSMTRFPWAMPAVIT